MIRSKNDVTSRARNERYFYYRVIVIIANNDGALSVILSALRSIRLINSSLFTVYLKAHFSFPPHE